MIEIFQEVKLVSRTKITFRRFRKNRSLMIGLYSILLYIFLATFYPLFISEGPKSFDPGHDRRAGGGANAFPNLKYPFGVTYLGHDSFSRVLIGAETSITVGILATLITFVIGVSVGLFAGYYQGDIEIIAMRVTDAFLTIPLLLIILILMKFAGSTSSTIDGTPNLLSNYSNVQVITLSLGLMGWGGLARLVTSNVKQILTLEFIDAAKIMGASNARIMWVHIFPNIVSSVIVVTTIFVAFAITSEAVLVFLGFGDPFKTISWGMELNNAYAQINLHPEQTLIPAFALFFMILAINMVGDGIKDALDPKLKD